MTSAVILCARKEKDSLVPYPLMDIGNSGCLMDRTLSILRENGFGKIIIVVGFCREMFRRFIANDVVIIENPDYEFTSSMASLALCDKNITEDFLLIDGDTFFEAKVIETLSEIASGNCMSMTEESGSGDECFVETKKGFVTKITKDRHRVRNFEGEMIGVTRLSLHTYRKMIDAWCDSNNPHLNYEYLFMDVTEALDRPYIYFKNLIWGDVDNQKDFSKLIRSTYRRLQRKENPFDEDNLREYLKQIFPDVEVSNAEIVQIGGLSNKNFKVAINGKNYVLRIPGIGSDGMVQRLNEEFNGNQAGRLGINPTVFYFNHANGVKLSKFIENSETLNAATVQRQNNMKKIVEIYKTLHGSRIRFKNEFNIFREIEKYETLMEEAHAEMYSGWEEVREKVMALELHLNSLGVDLKPCHNDGLYENFIKDENGKIYLIDWEYSGMNDPAADLAALFLEANFEKENENYVLSKYLGGEIPDVVRNKILCYKILWDYLWAIWTVIKEKKGDDFGSYGIERFNRAVRNLNIFHNHADA